MKKVTKTAESALSAEEKFDAIFGEPKKLFSETQADSIPTTFLFSNCAEEDETLVKPVPKKEVKPKETEKLPRPRRATKNLPKPEKKIVEVDILTKISPTKSPLFKSPFALAFGGVESDSDDDEDDKNNFGESGSGPKSAEKCWDEMMTSFDIEPKKKGIKLR